MRDLPLNKQQRKEGCLFLSFLLIIIIIGLVLLFIQINYNIWN
jgi:cell division septal protein FtsQ